MTLYFLVQFWSNTLFPTLLFGSLGLVHSGEETWTQVKGEGVPITRGSPASADKGRQKKGFLHILLATHPAEKRSEKFEQTQMGSGKPNLKKGDCESDAK